MDEKWKNIEKYGHVPVLMDEVVFWLQPKSHGCYVDCTLGPGGTASSILQACGTNGRLIAIDHDPQAIALAHETLKPYSPNVSFHCRNFRNLQSILDAEGMRQVDGIIFDLGVSSVQLADADRGFSFQRDGPLDMRMDPSQRMTAGELVNTWSETDCPDALAQGPLRIR